MTDAWWMRPWLWIGVSAIAVTVVATISPLLSSDAFMYVAIAENWIEHGMPSRDPFLIDPIKPFQILHEWLGYFVFWAAHRLGGFAGITLFKSFLFCCMTFVAVRAAIRWKTNALVFVLAFSAALTAAHFRMSERTSIFSDLFELVCLFFALELFHSRESLQWKTVLAMICMFVLWGNLHPGWLFGWILLAIGSLARLVQDRNRADAKTTMKLLATLLIGTLAALFVTPAGIEGPLYPLRFSKELRDVYSRYYFEWMPIYTDILTNFIEVKTFLIFGPLTAIVASVFAFRRSKIEAAYVAILCAIVIAPSFLHGRFIVISSFGALLIVAFAFREGRQPRLPFSLALLAAAIGVIVFAVVWPVDDQPSPVSLTIDATVLPTHTLESLAQLPPANVFASHEFGGVIAWRFQGRYPVLFHGFDVDVSRYLNDYMFSFQNEPNLIRVIEKYRIRYFLLDKHGGAEAIYKMLQPHGWKIHAYDQGSALLTPPEL